MAIFISLECWDLTEYRYRQYDGDDQNRSVSWSWNIPTWTLRCCRLWLVNEAS
jgi:hypothetical protein